MGSGSAAELQEDVDTAICRWGWWATLAAAQMQCIVEIKL